ncbi:D-alanyl-D-alanine carboxypeptidase/D-alanyl-D-alanine-endopeptidase [Streptacidiphilus sp. ASG 303]|uniref:D-alanyl-D-alanine carboxypeptidase/D-alanyl-D-alanine endopeptidase n=1 Tax=Streptacidiphilus sp. ASG 303 TaxID=2896847 RepID=UPI001E2E59FC|nr:D-alanyl-D-alanine carboxypeptidase/D-alanyl-D-alanine-endopeptidase [Streptacidiphilus sp. ASG 303]MCD0481029.1 D-alanyl-D-alanine carboxypeptidase/D-alanyl-D-alanine-endopeptidase [Streptacidiphilus sp. ASG 303]
MPRTRYRLLVPAVTAALTLGALGTAHAGAPAAAPRAAAQTAAQDGDPTLRADLDRILADPRAAGARAGVVVEDADTGQVLYEHQADEHLLPASTLKTFTSAAALHHLGTDRRFGTDVLAAGARHGAVLDGDLVLRGGGDFSLQPADLDALAARVAASGVRTVTGRLTADDTRYDAERLGSGWSWDDLSYDYAPQISALTLSPTDDDAMDTAVVTLTPAARAGDPATVTVTPAEAPIHLTGQVTTGAPGSGYSASVLRREGGNEVVLSGSLAADNGPDTNLVTVDDPTGYTAAVFRAALARHGVRVLHGTAEQAAPAGARVLAHHDSAPLGELLKPFLKESNNGIAEHLVKETGLQVSGEGSWSAGLKAVSDYVRGKGVDTSQIRQADGSGLTRYDQVTARQTAVLLRAVRSEPWFATWYDALPVAGVPEPEGGTLTNRMRGTAAAGNLHAKTGSMTGVTALAGYVTGPDGRRLILVADFDGYLGSSPRPLQDAIAVRLAGGPAAAARSAAAPPRTLPAPHPAKTRGPGADPDRCALRPAC